LLIGGKYRIEALLGHGAGSSVYLAKADQELGGTGQAPNRQEIGGTGQAPNRQEIGRTGQAPNRQEIGGTGQAPNRQESVAIKVLHLDGDWHSSERFRKGAEALRAFSHPSLPRYHGLFEDDRGTLFAVREYFAGGSLEQRVSNKQRIEAAAFNVLLDALLSVAQYLHNLVPPAIHANIKPSNILFRADSSWIPVLVDFESLAQPEQEFTDFGSAGFSAPELARGEQSPSCDLYAIGTSLLYLATHQHPDELPKDQKGAFRVEDRLAQIEPQARQVLLRLVAQDPKDRYPSATAALDALRMQARSKTSAKPARKGANIAAWVVSGVFLLLSAAVLGAGHSLAEWLRDEADSGCHSSAFTIEEAEGHGFCLSLSSSQERLACHPDRRRVEHFCRLTAARGDTIEPKQREQLAIWATKLELEHSLAATKAPSTDGKANRQQQSTLPLPVSIQSTDTLTSITVEQPAKTTPPPADSSPPQRGGAGQAPNGQEVESGPEQVKIEVTSSPSGAKIAIDAQSCISPCTLIVDKGETIMLELSKSGYGDKKQKVRALSDKTVHIELDKQ
jgi:serine/threonine protein kinase